jgi:hypothetical protein
MAPKMTGAAAASASATSHTGTANATPKRQLGSSAGFAQRAYRRVYRALAVVSGGTTNGTTCSRDSKLDRYWVAAC